MSFDSGGAYISCERGTKNISLVLITPNSPYMGPVFTGLSQGNAC